MGSLKDGFSSQRSPEKRWKYLLMLVAGAVLPACTSHVSDDLSVEGLGKSGDAVITMAAVLDSDRERACTNVGFEPLDSKTRTELYTQLPGRRFYRITLKLGTGTVLDAGNEIVGSMQIAPGAYKVAGALCQSSRGKVDVISADPGGLRPLVWQQGKS